MAKRVRVSADNVTYYTLPGNSADITTELGSINDTIFGQDFESSMPGLAGVTITSNAIYKGFAGYEAVIRKTGTPVPVTDEATTLVTGKTYRITNAAHRILDPGTTVVVEDNNVAVAAANILNIDYLYGMVTFQAAYTPTGPITITGAYVPTTRVCGANEWTLTQTAGNVDVTDMCEAQDNGGFRVYDYGLKTVSLQLNGFYDDANGFLAQLTSRDDVIIEINPDGSDLAVARGVFRAVNHNQAGDVGNPETESVTFNLSVPDIDLLDAPFSWSLAPGNTLNMGIQTLLAAWEDKTNVHAQYLPDGTTGRRVECIVTEMTLSGGLEAMNEFSVTLMGVAAPIAVP